MANLRRAEQRERKQSKRKHGMRISGRSIFTIVEVQVKKGQEVKRGKRK